MRVKCCRDGELSDGRRIFRGVHVASRCCIKRLFNISDCNDEIIAFGGIIMQKQNRTKSRASKTAVLAMLTAVSVVLGIICKNLFTFGLWYRFTLENLGVIFAGIFFGPTAGVLVGLASDAVSCLISTNPAVNPIISLGAASVGAASGVVARFIIKEHSTKQFAVAAASAHLIGQVTIKSIAKIVYFSMPWFGVPIALLFSAVACFIEVTVIRLLWKNRDINKLITGMASK